MANSKKNSTIIGYNYIIFQSRLDNFVKCWYDGSDNYDFVHIDDFVELFEKIGSNYSQIITLKKYLDTTNIYVWDVDNNAVFRARKDNFSDKTLGSDLAGSIKEAIHYIENKSQDFSINRHIDFL